MYMLVKTIKIFVLQVCQALCDLLSVEADCRPKSLEDWLKIADEFDSRWRLPHCLGI